jgi:Zn-finger protein
MSNLYRGPSIDASYQVSVWPSGFRRRIEQKWPIRNKNCLWQLFVNGSGRNMHLYKGPSIDAFYKVSVHLAKRLQSSRFWRNWPIRNKNCLWWPCLLTDWDEMNNLYRGSSIDAPYQVSVHLAKQFQRKRFKKNRPIKNKNCLWWPCLLTDQDKMCHLYRVPFIDASYQVSVHLVKWF